MTRSKLKLWQVEGLTIRELDTITETSSSYITEIIGGDVPCSVSVELVYTTATTRSISIEQIMCGVENYAWFVNTTASDIVLTFTMSENHSGVEFWAAADSNMSYTVKAGEACEFGWIRDDNNRIFFTERNRLTEGGA
jgi:hypothetical protein